jgi:hypothetical protein
MGIFNKNKNEMSILQKTQENLDVTQKNLCVIVDKMSQVLEKQYNNGKENMVTEEEKIRAAYALNLCTVSVSQIIDYNDLNILEQEYDAILNNLNIEYIPKDQVLLSTLKLLLDTITFFRIQEGDKKFIEKEYQENMKNAIWSAVPNFGLIVAGGNPWNMAVSLASQVGCGYMNYRKVKAQNQLDKEKAEWQLQKSAIEQFNGIRRELFDAAWRLADKYKFADKYRLTERKIKQYNNILMDPDDYRRFERLDAIKNNFQAYPPFWYYLGNTASLIAQKESDVEISLYYKDLAKKHFETFLKGNEYALLREDQVLASCCLEYIDLLDTDLDKKKINDLLEKAVETSGEFNDILQLCALYYIKIGNINRSATLLRQLVNEDYNPTANAQILSNIYVFDYINNHSLSARIDYKTLEKKVNSQFLFPMPIEGTTSSEGLHKEFIEKQRKILSKKYALVLESFIEKYSIIFNKTFPVPDLNSYYDDSYYLDDNDASQKRIRQIESIVANKNKAANYLLRLSDANISFAILDVLNRMFDSICFLNCVQDEKDLSLLIKMNIEKNKNNLNDLQKKISDNIFDDKALEILKSITFKAFTDLFFDEMVEKIELYINKKNSMSDFSYSEQNLREFCLREKISEPEMLFKRSENYYSLDEPRRVHFTPELLGEEAVKNKEKTDSSKKMIEEINKVKHELILNGEKTSFFVRGENLFETYISKKSSKFDGNLRRKIIAILEDRTFNSKDLLFTTTGIILVGYYSLKAETIYKDISRIDTSSDALKIKEKYKNINVDLEKMHELIQGLAEIIESEEIGMK